MELVLPAKGNGHSHVPSPSPSQSQPQPSSSPSNAHGHGRRAWHRSSSYQHGSPRGRRVAAEQQQSGAACTPNGDCPQEGVGAGAGAEATVAAKPQLRREPHQALRQAPALREVQEMLRQEWADFSSTLEDRMQEHFQRQEMLMNQQALRIEGIVSARSSQTPSNPDREAKAASSPSKSNSEGESPADGSTQSVSGSPPRHDFKPQELDVNLGEEVHANHTTPSRFHPESPHVLPEAMRANTKQVANLNAVMNLTRGAGQDHRDGEDGCLRLSMRSVEEVDKVVDNLIGREQPRKVCEHEPPEPAWKASMILDPPDAISTFLEWWMAFEEPTRRGCLADFIEGRRFEFLSALVVVLNSVVTVYTTNSEARDMIEDETLTVDMINFSFVIYYTVEIILKMYVHRLFFFFNTDMWWNLFDLGLVILAMNDMLLRRVIDTQSIDMSAMRTLRVMRLAKILRVVRVMRFFPELRLILNSVLGSIVSLFWSIVMLGLMFFIFSLVFVQGATTARIHDRSLTLDEQLLLEENLGSVQAGMLTLYQTTTGGQDWMTFYVAIEHTGHANCFLFLFFIAFAQFALLNILTGIFVENAMKLAQPDRDTLALQKRKEELREANELRRLFETVDTDHTGFIDSAHFKQHLESEQFKARLAMMGLDIKDAELFFGVVSDFGTNEVEVEAFVSGAMRLKGLASALDLQTLTFGTKAIHANQIKFHRAMEERFNQIMSFLDS